MVKNPPVSTEDARDTGLIPGSGRSPGGGNGNPLQYSCLGNPMDRGAWWATAHEVAKNWTKLSDWACMIIVTNIFIITKMNTGLDILRATYTNALTSSHWIGSDFERRWLLLRQCLVKGSSKACRTLDRPLTLVPEPHPPTSRWSGVRGCPLCLLPLTQV